MILPGDFSPVRSVHLLHGYGQTQRPALQCEISHLNAASEDVLGGREWMSRHRWFVRRKPQILIGAFIWAGAARLKRGK